MLTAQAHAHTLSQGESCFAPRSFLSAAATADLCFWSEAPLVALLVAPVWLRISRSFAMSMPGHFSWRQSSATWLALLPPATSSVYAITASMLVASQKSGTESAQLSSSPMYSSNAHWQTHHFSTSQL